MVNHCHFILNVELTKIDHGCLTMVKHGSAMVKTLTDRVVSSKQKKFRAQDAVESEFNILLSTGNDPQVL